MEFDQIKIRGTQLFAGIAEQLAPAIDMALKFVDSFDLTKIGTSIGTFIAEIIQAIGDGKMTAILKDSLEIGFKEGVNYFIGGIQTVLDMLGAGLAGAFELLGDSRLWQGLLGEFVGIKLILTGVLIDAAAAFG